MVTSRVIASFLSAYRPDSLVTDLGGHGVAAVFDGRDPGPTVLVRCELDALAIEGNGEVELASSGHGTVAHRCGHDAHMTMVAALAPALSIRRPARGRVVLLFQPAEETGEGAKRVLADPKFEAIRPDFALALHNLPGEPAGSIVVRRGHFACGSVGLEAQFEGIAAHAAEPEQARTPTDVLCGLLARLPAMSRGGDHFRLLTVTHTRMGERSFGITPGSAELLATLRAVRDEDLVELREEAAACVVELAAKDGIDAAIEWRDEFPSTVNDASLVDVLEAVSERSSIPLRRSEKPFRWSEDFGHFRRVCPTLLFGLGIGEDAPGLHQPDHAVPDALIPVGSLLWSRLTQAILEADGAAPTA
jgi:amidohydrolase